MGFMDKAKKLAEQAQQKLDEAQKNFNQSQAAAGRSRRRAACATTSTAARSRRRRPPRPTAAAGASRRARRRSRRAGAPAPTPPAAAAAAPPATAARTRPPTRSSRSSSDGAVLPRQHEPRRHPHRDGHAVRRGRATRRGRRRAAHAPPARERLRRPRARRQHGRGRHDDRRGEGPAVGARRGRVRRRADHRRHRHLRHPPLGRAHRARPRDRRGRDAGGHAVLRAARTGAGSRRTTRRWRRPRTGRSSSTTSPSRTATDMPNDLLAELAEIDNVAAVKQARYEDLAPIEGMDLLAGNDDVLAKVMDMGGTGRDPRGVAPGRPRDAADHRRARAPPRDRGLAAATSTRR